MAECQSSTGNLRSMLDMLVTTLFVTR